MSVVAWALLALSAVGLIARFTTQARPMLIGVSAFAPYLMIAAPVAAIMLALARGWVGLVVAVVVTVACTLTQAPLYVASTTPSGGRTVVVMTANLRLGNGSATDVVAAVRDRRVDLLMLEELTPQALDRLMSAGLRTLLPHDITDPRSNAAGTGLFSRFPLSDPTKRTDFAFAFVTARVHIPGLVSAPLAMATHLAGPLPRSALWSRDIAHLPTVLRSVAAGVPSVLGGDLNATPDHTQFRRLLTNGFQDAANQAGAGATPTYPADRWYPPLIAIDHVLARGAVARSLDSLTIHGSDHRALVVQLAFPHTPRP